MRSLSRRAEDFSRAGTTGGALLHCSALAVNLFRNPRSTLCIFREVEGPWMNYFQANEALLARVQTKPSKQIYFGGN